jgi:hypothetical protein
MNKKIYEPTPLHRKILKNFNNICSNQHLKKDSPTWTTLDQNRRMHAKYEVDTPVPFDLIIGDTGQFLNAFKHFESPVITADEENIIITQDNIDSVDELVIPQYRADWVKPTLADKLLVNISEPVIEFDMTVDDMEWLLKMAKEMKIDGFTIFSSRGNLVYLMEDQRNASYGSKVYRRTNIKTNQLFIYHAMKVNHFDMLFKSDYRVSIRHHLENIELGIMIFTNKHIPLTYSVIMNSTADLRKIEGKAVNLSEVPKLLERYIDQ